MPTKKQKLLEEYRKKASDYKYAIENTLQTYDGTQKKFVSFKLFPRQKEFLKNLCNENKNITVKNRQAGVTTVSCAYAATAMVFASKNAPELIVCVAHNQTLAKKNLQKIKNFIDQYQPERFYGSQNRYLNKSQTYLKLPNGSEAMAIANSEDAGRGGTPTFIIMDEAAFIEGGEDAYTAIINSQATGGRLVMLSTPNGLDEVYYKTYENAQYGNNDYKVTNFRWYEDPRFNSDLKWVYTDDIIDYIKKEPQKQQEEVIDDTQRSVSQTIMFRQGYKPWSTWFENQCRDNNLDKRKIAQELQCTFIGSGDNVIDTKIIEQQETENVMEPESTEMDGDLWIWKAPKKDHKYIAALDVSLGTAEDYTGYTIIDFDTFEQVLEYKGKVKPDDAADIINKYSRLYNAFTTLDITGGWGHSTYRKLIEYKFPLKLLHYEKDMLDKHGLVTENSIAGINFQKKNNRTKIIEAMEEAMRTGFIVRSSRLITEMKKFIYDENGRPDHMKGAHDDVLMAVAMCLYLAETHFKQLETNKNATETLLNSWKVSTKPIDKVPYDQEKANDPLMDSYRIHGADDEEYLEQMGIHDPNHPRNAMTYNWLFGRPKNKGLTTKKKH